MSLWYSGFYGNRGHDPLTTCPSAWDTAWHTVHRQELPSKLTSICEFLFLLLLLLWDRISPCCRELRILLCQPSECWGYGHGYGCVQPHLLRFALVNIFLDCLKFPIIPDSLNIDIAGSQDCLEIPHMRLLWLYGIASLYWDQEGHHRMWFLTWTYLYHCPSYLTVTTRDWTGLLGHSRLCAIKYITTILFPGKCPPWNHGYPRAVALNLPDAAALQYSSSSCGDNKYKVIFIATFNFATVVNHNVNIFDYRGLLKGSWSKGSEPLPETVLSLPRECSLLRSVLYLRSCHFLSLKLGVSTSSFRKKKSLAEYLKSVYILNFIWYMTV